MPAITHVVRHAAHTLGATALLSAVLGQFGRVLPVLDVFNHFAPAIAVLAILAFGLTLLAGRGRSWRTIGLITATTLAICALQMSPELRLAAARAQPSTQEGEQLRILVFNAWVDNQRSESAASWILGQRADVVVLLEGRRIRQRLIDAGYLPACYGCSPVILARQRPLRRHPPPRVWNDASGVTMATYTDGVGAFTVVGVHGRWPTAVAELSRQSKVIQNHIAGADRARLIIAGDFNSTPWSFARQAADRNWGLERRTIALPTWPAARVSHNRGPAPFPYLPIDHVYAGSGWTTVSVRRGPELGSDHYPVVVTLAPAAPAS